MTRLLIATTNPGKVAELRRVLAAQGLQGLEVDDLSSAPGLQAAQETGHTILENACLKASYYARKLSQWTLADDSGLAVDALHGKPGVHSARWAQLHNAGEGDAANNALLLQQMIHVEDSRRTARFVCSLALADPRGLVVVTMTDFIEGLLLHEPRGTHGFGYDPLFLVPPLGKTTAELPPDQKNAISHRGKATRRMADWLRTRPDLP